MQDSHSDEQLCCFLVNFVKYISQEKKVSLEIVCYAEMYHN